MADGPTSGGDERHQRIADALKNGERSAVLLGNISVQHPSYAQLQYLAVVLSKATGATLGMLPERANTAGAWLAGALPHRVAGGKKADNEGLNAKAMFEASLSAYLLVGCELEFDAANPAQALNALASAGSVVAISSFMSDSLRAHADVILPSATFTEAFGTYVNATGNWQSSKGIVAPPGDARPAWKIFRVLADELELGGFGYESPEAVTKELQSHCGNVQLTNMTQFDSAPSFAAPSNASLLRAGETPIYATDPIVRRSQPLQKSSDGKQAFISMAANALDALSAKEGDVINVKQNGVSVPLPCKLDNDIPQGCVWVPTGIPETAALGYVFGEIEVSKA